MNPRIWALLAIPACFLLSACTTADKTTYLALGDSIAVGQGASSEIKDGYVALFHSHLGQQTGKTVSLRNLAVSGETTASMIAEGQLAKALAELRFRNQDDHSDNDVVVITLTLGANDLLGLAQPGQPCEPPVTATDSACQTAVSDAMKGLSANLGATLRTLRVSAGPNVPIFVTAYYNPFAGTNSPLEAVAGQAVLLLNEQINRVAADPLIDAEVVETADAFEGRVSDLTHAASEGNDPHPNDAGHKVLAELLIDAYGR